MKPKHLPGRSRLVEVILRLIRDADHRHLIREDLYEEYVEAIGRGHGRKARQQYWLGAVRSIADTWTLGIIGAVNAPRPRRAPGELPHVHQLANRTRPLTDLMQDLGHALRQIERHPTFALAVVLVLALGIGANTAVFSVVEGALLRDLPFPDAERLVRVYEDVPDYGLTGASLPGFGDWDREKGPFESLGAMHTTIHSLTGEGSPERIRMGRTVGDFFGTAGVSAAMGRVYGLEDGMAGRTGTEPVVVLTDQLWRRSFGADPRVIGKTVSLDGLQYRVLGVMPETERLLRFGSDIDAWSPMGEPLFWMGRGTNFLRVIGRLRPGLTPETAAAPLLAFANGLKASTGTESGMAITPLREDMVGDTRLLLIALQGAALLLMLVVAINAANLLLARALDRTGEFSVRTALGAGRGRVARQVLVETSVLGLLGGGAGLVLALVGRGVVLDATPELAALAGPTTLSWPMLAFTFGSALGVGLLAGLWPALRATGRSWSGMRQSVGRGAGGAQAGRRAMVALEVGLALMLLVGAGLMVRTVSGLLNERLGFEPEGVLTVRVTLSDDGYPDAAGRIQFFDALATRLQAVPGLEAFAFTDALPLSGQGDTGAFSIEHQEGEASGRGILKSVVSAGYFNVLGIPILAGREFSSLDHAGAASVAVVSESLARLAFPNESPLGRRIHLGWWGDEFVEIVGVVGDVKHGGLDQGMESVAYLAQAQVGAPSTTIVARASGEPLTLVDPIRSAVLDTDPGLPIYQISTMDQVVSSSVGRRAALTSLLLGLSLIALLISCLGVYAVTAQAVRSKGHEIGIRLALGARGQDVLSSVMIAEGKVITIGLLMGLAGVLVSTRVLETFLFGVDRLDPATLVGSTVVLGGVALLSALGPALRGSRIDPARSLRGD